MTTIDTSWLLADMEAQQKYEEQGYCYHGSEEEERFDSELANLVHHEDDLPF